MSRICNSHDELIGKLNELESITGKTDDDITREMNLRAQDMKCLRDDSYDDIDTVTAIAEFFGVTVDYLVGQDKPYTAAKIADAKPDVVSFDEQELECMARLLMYSLDHHLKGADDAYSCSFCKYRNDCFDREKRYYFRQKLRRKIASQGYEVGLRIAGVGRYINKPERGKVIY